MYIFSKKSIINNNHRIGEKPIKYVMNDIESIDIDIESDLIIAKLLINYYKNLSIRNS